MGEHGGTQKTFGNIGKLLAQAHSVQHVQLCLPPSHLCRVAGKSLSSGLVLHLSVVIATLS